MYVRFPLTLRNVEDLLFEHGIDLCHETVRFWWNKFGPLFAADIRRQRVSRMRGFRHCKWHLDETYVRVNGEMVYLWRAVDHEGEVLESYVTKTRDKAAALRFMTKALKRHGSPVAITTDGLRAYRAAMAEFGNAEKQEMGRYADNRAEQPFAIPTTRAGDAALQTDEVIAEIRFRPRLASQPLCPGTPPGRPHHIHGTPLRQGGRVAGARRLKPSVRDPSSAKWRLVRRGLTAPRDFTSGRQNPTPVVPIRVPLTGMSQARS